MSWKTTVTPSGDDKLYSDVKGIAPSLDLRFAESKSMVDHISGNDLITFSRADATTCATYVDANGIIQTAAANTPRFDHDPTTGESLGLLIEESRTNYFFDLTTGTVTIGTAPPTKSIITGTVPDGSTGSIVSMSYQVGDSRARWAITGDGVSTYHFSVYWKLQGDASWNRFDKAAITAPTFAYADVTTSDLGVPSESVVYFAFSQIEKGSFPTSYIPTAGSTVTRAADVAEITGSNFTSFYNQTEGTVFTDVASKGVTGIDAVFAIGSSGDNDRWLQQYFTLGSVWYEYEQGSPPAHPYTGGTFIKSAIGRSQGDNAVGLSGTIVQTDSYSGAYTPTFLKIGVSGDPNRTLNGHIKRLTYFPERLSDAKLVKATLDTPLAITYGLNATGTFNLLSAGTVDYTVDWNDDSTESSTANTLAHSYSTGIQAVSVYSDQVYRPYFNNVSADVDQITSVTISSDAQLGTNLTSAWYGANNMTSFKAPFASSSGVTYFGNAWSTCSSLASFPLIDTSSGTSFSYTWLRCSSLTSFPLLDTSSATTLSGAWRECSSLTSFPLINTSNVTSFNEAWFSCTSLASFPLIDTSSGTSFNLAWFGCSSLTSFPLINTSSGTSFNQTWRNCSSLTSFPLLDTSSGTSFNQTWRDCNSLTSFPLLDTSSGTNFSFAWSGCSSLTSFPANMFDTTGTLVATAFDNAFANCALTAQSIENILVSLDANGQSGVTLTINGGTNAVYSTWSTAAQTALTNLQGKGWTVYYNT